MKDLIDRQAAKDAVANLPNCYNGFSDTYDKAYIIDVLDEVPSAQPERKKGKWIYKDYDLVICSECGAEYNWIVYRANFCEECGADMREEKS